MVRAGDSLSKIAAAYGVKWQAIAEANHIGNPRVIQIGQRLLIPSTRALRFVYDLKARHRLHRRVT